SKDGTMIQIRSKQVTVLQKESEHNLSTTLKVKIQKGTEGFGLVIIQHGPFLQIVSLIEKGPADRTGKLKPGDILLKTGHVNVLGYKLRELRQLLNKIPIGAELQIMVYRDYIDIPEEWAKGLYFVIVLFFFPVNRTSIKDEPTEDWTSSDEDYNENEVGSDGSLSSYHKENSFWYDSSTKLPPVSRTWHANKKNQRVLIVGKDIGCDIMIHDVVNNLPGIDQDDRTISPHWADDMVSTSSSSSADAFWLEDCA
uniref:PDZ domain containing 9 n=1 Tax=Latimeria chalumnae TaxID=7897 RepID=H3AGT8_LATCH